MKEQNKTPRNGQAQSTTQGRSAAPCKDEGPEAKAASVKEEGADSKSANGKAVLPEEEAPSAKSVAPSQDEALPTLPKEERKELSPLRQRLQERYRDQQPDLSDDATAERLALQWAEELTQELSRYGDAEGRLTQLIAQDPQFGRLITAIAIEGQTPHQALRSNYQASDLAPNPDEEGYDRYQQQQQQRQQAQTDYEAESRQLAANMEQSERIMDQFCAEHELDEAQQRQMAEAINSDWDNLLQKRVTPAMLEGYLHRMQYADDVDRARAEGELNGRNANISARIAQDLANERGDGLPDPASAYSPSMLRGRKPVIDFTRF